ncbi:hypothetical protein BC834DRAFT_604968 [Gloeopeniophorella convolvens]|nr:hypothetical protein BC834DRAFT_604968 [Gloeopeniophorella convolvens]
MNGPPQTRWQPLHAHRCSRPARRHTPLRLGDPHHLERDRRLLASSMRSPAAAGPCPRSQRPPRTRPASCSSRTRRSPYHPPDSQVHSGLFYVSYICIRRAWSVTCASACRAWRGSCCSTRPAFSIRTTSVRGTAPSSRSGSRCVMRPSSSSASRLRHLQAIYSRARARLPMRVRKGAFCCASLGKRRVRRRTMRSLTCSGY